MKEPTQADYEAGRILHEAWYNVGRATAPPFDLIDRFDRLRWIETAKVSHAAHAKAQLEQDWKTLPNEDAPLVKWAKQIPPKRPWVGLTDEETYEVTGTASVELFKLAKQWSANEIHVYQFDNEARKIIKAVLFRATEAAHGIKETT